MAYQLTRKAEEDLTDIYLESARLFGEAQADAYLAGIERTIETLARHPQMAPERTEISPPVRVHPHGSHIIIYAIDQQHGMLIIRVRHGREDWQIDPV